MNCRIVAISYLLHVYLLQYGQYFPHFSYFFLLCHSPQDSWNNLSKCEKLVKYWSYCTRNCATNNAYHYWEMNKRHLIWDGHKRIRLRQYVPQKCDRYLLNLSKCNKQMFKMNKCDRYLPKVRKYAKHLFKIWIS